MKNSQLVMLLVLIAVLYSCKNYEGVVKEKVEKKDIFAGTQPIINELINTRNADLLKFNDNLQKVNSDIVFVEGTFADMIILQIKSDNQFRNYHGTRNLKEIPNTNFTVVTHEVPFATNQYKLQSNKYQKDSLNIFCDEINRLTNEYSEIVINILGYTDPIGSYSYNKELSLKRATSVYNYLNDAISSRKVKIIKPKGFGKDEIGPQKRLTRIFVYLINKKSN